MEARYRKDYDGEFVIANSHWSQAKNTQKREWIPNAIENHHISGRAAIIGSRTDVEVFDYKRLQKHRGGLLGKNRLQIYGTGDLWKDIKFDFYVTNDPNQLYQIQKTGYSDENIVFTSSRYCLQNPGKFYLIPYFQPLDQLVQAVYLSAFDGHNEIFLIGYNNETPAGQSTWFEQLNAIFAAYTETSFILLGVESNMPDIWRNNSNVSCMDYRSWISYCDV